MRHRLALGMSLLAGVAAASAQSPGAAGTTGTAVQSGGTPGQWIQGALARHQTMNAKLRDALQSATPDQSASATGQSGTASTSGATNTTGSSGVSSLLGALGLGNQTGSSLTGLLTGQSTTGSGTSQQPCIWTQLLEGLLQNYLGALTGNLQSQTGVNTLMSALAPLILPPSSSAASGAAATTPSTTGG